MNTINGYVVVGPTRLNYRGVDRNPWELIGDAYYDNLLPDDLRTIYEHIRSLNARAFWWATATTRPHAELLLRYSQKINNESMLLGVYSGYIDAALNRAPWSDPDATFLGIDVVAIGTWSLLRAIEEAPNPYPSSIASLLNEAGLLDDESRLIDIERYHETLSANRLVEELPSCELGVEPVRIYRIDV